MLFDKVEVDFPGFTPQIYDFRLPFTSWTWQLTYPGFFFSSVFYFGLGALSYYSFRKFTCLYRSTRDYIKSFTNSAKFLTSQRADLAYTAVVYGASTTVGKLYSLYLARKGFNLILVERDLQQLNLLESTIRKDTSTQVRVVKVAIDKFDQDSLWKAFGGNREVKMHQAVSPVKIFVNCKNSKRKATPVEVERMQLSDSMMGESLLMDESAGLADDQRIALKQLWQPAITKEEVFFTSKENIDGFVCILSYFLTQMVSPEVDHPCLINIDNHCPARDEKAEQGQLFFNSLLHFKDAFTSQLPKHCGDRVKTITVKTDFNNIPTSIDQQKV